MKKTTVNVHRDHQGRFIRGDDTLLTVVDTARILNMDKNRIYHAINTGRLPTNVVDGTLMVRIQDLSKVDTQQSRGDFVDLMLTVSSKLRRG